MVYLTHLIKDSIDWKVIAKITGHALTSVEHGYTNIRAVIGVRRLIPVRNLIFDSGGFAAFTKGINVSVSRTIHLYKVVKYDPSTDYLVELDHIPFYDEPMELRIEKIRKNLRNYLIMKRELGDNVLYVVHGWSTREIEVAVENHRYMDDKVAVGSYYVASVLNKAPRVVVFKRFSTVMRFVVDSYSWILVLGGSGPNMIHLSFYTGAHAVDGVAWRNAARRKEIIVPGLGVYALNNSKRRRFDTIALKALKEWWNHDLNPFKDLSINEFLLLALRDFKILALWNAAAMKIEEEIANEYVNDPDRYYSYLSKRWENNCFWRNVLKLIRSNYVQSKLTVYLRSSLGG